MRRPGSWSSEDDKPLPEPTFIRQVIGDLWDGLFGMVVWALAALVASIPVIFILYASPPLGVIAASVVLAPALAGLMAMMAKAAKGGFARLGEAWQGTFRLYRRSVALALPVALLLAVILVSGGVVARFPERSELFIAWAFQIGIALAAAILHIYLLPILALFDTTVKQTVLLATLLAVRHIWQTLALLALAVLLLAATRIHPLVMLFVPGVWSVVVVNATWRLGREYVSGANDSGPGAN